jgi:hypothetical protein
MSETMPYCKAYLAKDLRAYSGWSEDVSALRPETEEVDGEEKELVREELQDDDILYVHDNYVVTDGIFRDEHVVFADVTDEWKRYCHEQLAFEVPDYEPIEIQPGPAAEVPPEPGEAPAAN